MGKVKSLKWHHYVLIASMVLGWVVAPGLIVASGGNLVVAVFSGILSTVASIGGSVSALLMLGYSINLKIRKVPNA